MNLKLGPGLTVLTGETGAGKSIIVDAVGLVVGARASAEYIRAGAERAVVSAVFRIEGLPELRETLAEMGIPHEEEELLLSREITNIGRGTCRINGRSVTLSMYQQIGQMLVDIHGQHAYQSILRPAYQMDMIDALAGIRELGQKVKELYYLWKEKERELSAVAQEVSDRVKQKELFAHQVDEINSACLKRGEEEELLQTREIMRNAERLVSGTGSVYGLLYEGEGRAAYDLISSAVIELQTLATIDPNLQHWKDMMESAAAQVREAARGLRYYGDSIHFDSRDLKQVEERLDLIYSLKRKYGQDITEIIRYKEKIEETLKIIEANNITTQRLQEEIAALEEQYRKEAELLRYKREQAAGVLEKEIDNNLKNLDMPEAKIRIVFEKASQPGPRGLDNINIMFQPNPGEGIKPLSQIASGGEMARVMLAFKNILALVDPVPVIIFDEIDAGVGGVAAKTMAKTLENISKNRQVICITHSAQLAGCAEQHFLINKIVVQGRTFTNVEELKSIDRVEEIARLLSGETSTAAMEHAATLIKVK